MKLQPKLAVLRKLEPAEMETDLELGFGKARYKLLAEINERLEEGPEEEVDENILEKAKE